MNTTLSIITISYNNIAGLKKTVESVLSQTILEFEYIVIDGESEDGTKHFLEERSEQISYWVSEKDTGVYNAMNKGIRAAKGEYLLFLNSGDELVDGNVVKNFFEYLQSQRLVDIIYGDYKHRFHNGESEIRKMPSKLSLDWFYNATIAHTSTFIRKSLFERYGMYNEQYKIVADWLFFFKLYLQPSITFSHYSRVISCFEEGGVSTRISSQNLLNYERKKGLQELLPEDFIRIFEENKKLYTYWDRYHLNKITQLLRQLKYFFKKTSKPIQFVWLKLTYMYNSIGTKVLYNFFKRKIGTQYKNIPIIINNRNRYSFPQRLIISLEKRGYRNIYIIDNNSTNIKVFDFYKELPYKIFYLSNNAGFCALWDTEVFKYFSGVEYVYTDSDVELSEDCSEDILSKMLFYLHKYSYIDKVGLGLRIDDLPDHYSLKTKVVDWESELLKKARRLEKDVVEAPVDTTFALYRRDKFGPANYLRSVRLQGRDMIKHLPWYIDPRKLSEEEKFYIDTANTNFYAYWTRLVKESI